MRQCAGDVLAWQKVPGGAHPDRSGPPRASRELSSLPLHPLEGEIPPGRRGGEATVSKGNRPGIPSLHRRIVGKPLNHHSGQTPHTRQPAETPRPEKGGGRAEGLSEERKLPTGQPGSGQPRNDGNPQSSSRKLGRPTGGMQRSRRWSRDEGCGSRTTPGSFQGSRE